MKLTFISATNVLGIRRVSIPLTTPIVVLAGNNGNGKTSVLDAVTLAMTGAPARDVVHKKDYGQLVHNSDGTGDVTVSTAEGRDYFMALPKGKGAHCENQWLPFVLDATRLPSLKPADRKTALFNLLGLDLSAKAVKPRMEKMGLDMAKAERVLPMLRLGFDEAAKVASEQATQEKGAWRAITGEVWGKEKGIDWSAPVPEFSQASLDELLATSRDVDQAMATANQQVGALQAQLNAQRQQAESIAALKERAAKLPRIIAKQAVDSTDLMLHRETLEKLKAIRDAAAGMACPECGAVIRVDGKKLTPIDAEKCGIAEDLDRIPALEHAVRFGESAVANNERDRVDALAAKQQLDAFEAAGPEVKQSEVDAAKQKAADLSAKRAQITSQIDSLSAAKRAADQAAETTEKAAQHHASITAWLAIAEALGPNGIPGQMVTEALAPFNDRLAQAAQDTGWPAVRVSPDMLITYGGRPYQLLSKSEKWRAEAMLAEAVSFLSGLKLIALDGLDVLGMTERAQALAWFDTLAINNEIDTLLVTATLKSAHAQWPASVSAYWVHDGVCEAQQLEEAA